MQISRHWRMNSQRYRLEGVRYGNGLVALQNRPLKVAGNETETGDAAYREELHRTHPVKNQRAVAVA